MAVPKRKHASCVPAFGIGEQVLADERPGLVPGVHRRRGLRQAPQEAGPRLLPVLLLPLEGNRRDGRKRAPPVANSRKLHDSHF